MLYDRLKAQGEKRPKTHSRVRVYGQDRPPFSLSLFPTTSEKPQVSFGPKEQLETAVEAVVRVLGGTLVEVRRLS